jgi:hypothetical protein
MTYEPIPEDEATSLEIPGEWDPILRLYSPGGAWQWADPILAGADDSAKWDTWPATDYREGPFELRVSQDVIRRLYASGYALVKVPASLPQETTEDGP